MKALTLHQPWASLVSCGAKTIETRSWSTNYRGPFAIHAAKTLDGFGSVVIDSDENWARGYVGDFHVGYYFEACHSGNRGDTSMAGPRVSTEQECKNIPLGAIVARCELVDVVPIVSHDTHDVSLPFMDSDECESRRQLHFWDRKRNYRDFSGQEPYGNFTPGRYAWLLDNIKPTVPIDVSGHQGLWDWEGSE